jgi:hypothetical protein
MSLSWLSQSVWHGNAVVLVLVLALALLRTWRGGAGTRCGAGAGVGAGVACPRRRDAPDARGRGTRLPCQAAVTSATST